VSNIIVFSIYNIYTGILPSFSYAFSNVLATFQQNGVIHDV